MISKKNICLIYILLLLEFLLLFNSKTIIESVKASSIMFILKIFPSLFPTMVLGSLLIKNNIHLIIPNFIKRFFNTFFNFNDITTGLFMISMLTGTPSNAVYINEYVDKKLITEKEAESLLCSTHFINPLFVIGGVGVGVFKSAKIGFLLLLLLWINNFFKAYLNRNKLNKNNNKHIKLEQKSMIKSLIESIKNSINSLLMIFGIVTTFNILVTLISSIFNLSYLSNCIINGFLEMTGGIIKLSSLNINIIPKFILAYILLNFGGICIHMQTFGMLENKKIRYNKYLIFRLF